MKLLERKRGNIWLGATYYYFGRFQFYLGLPGTLLTLAIFWQTGGWKYLPIPFYALITIFIVCGVVLLLFENRYATHAIAAWSNKVNQEQNPVLEEIKELRKEIKELKKMRK